MNQRIHLILVLLSTYFFAFGKTVRLDEALHKKWVSSTIVMQPNEATNGRNLRLSLKNLTKEALIITVPVGFIFESADTTVQDFVHLENKELQLASLATKSAFVKALCIRATRRSPHDGDRFLAQTLASGNLFALTAFAFEKKLYNLDAMQSALWAVTDHHELTGIDHLELAKFVAQQLNKPLPDYFVHYKNRDMAGETAAASLEPLDIQGVFQYTLPNDQQLKLDLVDSAGTSVLKDFNLVETMNQTKGKHRFTFSLMLKGIPRGTYFVKMIAVSDGKEWASKQVVF